MSTACASSLGLVMLDNSSVAVALPSIARGLQGAVADLQWTVAAFSLASATVLPLSGVLGRRFGSRATARCGLLLFALAAGVCAAAPSVAVLLAGRVGMGVSSALMLPNAAALLAANVSAADQPRAVGRWVSISSTGLFVGSFASGAISESVSWRVVFLLPVPVALAGFVALGRLTDTTGDAARQLDLRGVVAGGLALASACFAVVEGGRSGYAQPRVLVAVGIAVASALALALAERRAPDPVLDPALVRQPVYAAVLVATFAYNATFAAGLFLLAVYVQDVRGYAATVGGLVVLAMVALLPVGASVGGRLVERVGLRLPMVVSVVGLAAAYAGIALSGQLSVGLLVLPLLVTGLAGGVLLSGETLAVLAAVPPRDASPGLAALSLARQSGLVLGVACYGALAGVVGRLRLPDDVAVQVGDDPRGLLSTELPPAVLDTARDAAALGIRAGLLAAALVLLPVALLLRRRLPAGATAAASGPP